MTYVIFYKKIYFIICLCHWIQTPIMQLRFDVIYPDGIFHFTNGNLYIHSFVPALKVFMHLIIISAVKMELFKSKNNVNTIIGKHVFSVTRDEFLISRCVLCMNTALPKALCRLCWMKQKKPMREA